MNPLANVALQKSTAVKWADFLPPPAKFTELNRVQKIAGACLLGLAVLGALGTAYVGVAFTATPLIIICTFSTLAVLTIALTAASLYLLCKAPSKNDPEYCRQKAVEAGTDIVKNRMGYEQIRTKYGHLIDLKRINLQSLRSLLHADACALTFAEFKDKHGSELAYDFVTKETQQILKGKYLEHVRQETTQASRLYETLQAHAQSKNARILGVTHQELSLLIAQQLEQDAAVLSFVDYRKKHDLALLGAYLTPLTQQHMKKKYLEHVQQKAGRLDGFLALKNSPEALSLGVTASELIPLVMESEKGKFLISLDYLSFLQRNGFDFVRHSFENGDKDFRDKLEQSFLSLSFEEARTQRYAEERKLFNIEGVELLKRYSERVNRFAETMPYLGAAGFKQKYGIEFLIHNLLTAANFDRYQQEIFEHLVAAPSLDALNQFIIEMQVLGITEDMVLKARWIRMPIQKIATNELEIFLNEALRLFKREEIAGKLLSETRTVIELLRLSPDFFTRGFVLPQDALPGHPPVSHRLEQEIKSLNRIEELTPGELDLIFNRALISKTTPHLKTKALNFIASHASAILSGLVGAQAYWNLFVREQLVSPQIVAAYQVERSKVIAEEEQKRQRLSAINQVSEEAIRSAEQKRDAALLHAQVQANLNSLEQERSRLGQLFSDAERAATRSEEHLQGSQRALSQAETAWQRFSYRSGELQGEITSLQQRARDKHSLKMSVRQAELKAAQLKQRIEDEGRAHHQSHSAQIRSLESAIQNAKHDIDRLQAALRNKSRAEGEYRGQQRELQGLQSDLKRLPDNVAQKMRVLEAEIAEEEPRHNKPVTGIVAAYANRPRKDLNTLKRSLEALKDVDAKRAKLEREIQRRSQAVSESQRRYEEEQVQQRSIKADLHTAENKKRSLNDELDTIRRNCHAEEARIKSRYNLSGALNHVSHLAADYQKAKAAHVRINKLTAELQQHHHHEFQTKRAITEALQAVSSAETERNRAVDEKSRAHERYRVAVHHYDVQKEALTKREEALRAACQELVKLARQTQEGDTAKEETRFELALKEHTTAFATSLAI